MFYFLSRVDLEPHLFSAMAAGTRNKEAKRKAALRSVQHIRTLRREAYQRSERRSGSETGESRVGLQREYGQSQGPPVRTRDGVTSACECTVLRLWELSLLPFGKDIQIAAGEAGDEVLRSITRHSSAVVVLGVIVLVRLGVSALP